MRNRRHWVSTVVTAVALAMVAASSMAAGVAAAGVQPASIAAVRPETPAVSGGRLVWADRRFSRYDVFCYDALTRATSVLTADGADHTQPSIAGNTVAWTDYRNGDADIYAYDLVTHTERALVVAGRDQIHPSMSERWVVWEDHGVGYGTPVIRGLSLSGGSVIGVSGSSKGIRPRLAGDLVVWEGVNSGQVSSSIKAYNLQTGGSYAITNGTQPAVLPATDGRYVVWAEGDGTNLDVRAFDTHTSRYIDVATGPGEQTSPQVANGVIYWIDNPGTTRMHIDAYDLASGKTTPFNDYGTEDVAAVTASGADVVWLARSGAGWKLRGVFDSGSLALSALSRFVPSLSAGASLARLSADPTAPEVSAVSVASGALNVPEDSVFTVRFSEALDPASVTGNSVRIVDGSGDAVPGRVRYSPLTKSVSVTPDKPLGEGTYALAVDASVSDPSGNALPKPLTVPFSTIGILADTVAPYPVTGLFTNVYQGDSVKLTWSATWDPGGSVDRYYVYRSNTPTQIVDFPSDATLVTSTTGLEAIVAARAGEKDSSYEYYYVVTAKDLGGLESVPSGNDAPNPHGTSGKSTNTCLRCHSVHGAASTKALGAKSADACYECHGGTGGSTAYGYASSMDAQADFRDDAAVSTQGPEVLGRGSIHRNSYLVVAQTECDSCHTPHKLPNNIVQPSLSYNRLIRSLSTTNPVKYDYNTDAVAIGNTFCADCHGASSTNLKDAGAGDLAYINSGGNHLTNYATSAHATASVPANDANPGIQCLACHNNHAAGASKLIDYRDSATSTTAYDQAGLCYKCHSNPAAPDNVSGHANNAWNGRDIKAQFAKKSSHPEAVQAAAPPPPAEPSQPATWAETDDVVFTADARTNVVVVGSGDAAYLELAADGSGYQQSGVATSGVVTPARGTIAGWTRLVVNGQQPAGTVLRIDVLDGFTGSELSTDYALGTIPLAGIDEALHPTLQLRARFTANAPGTPLQIADTFGDSTIDAMWTNTLLGSATSPNFTSSGGTVNLYTLTFASTTFLDPATGMDALSPTTNQWARNTNTGSDGTTAGYARTGTTNHVDHSMIKNLGDLRTYASVNVAYDYRSAALGANDYCVVEWSTNGGTSWTTLRTHTSTQNTNSGVWTPRYSNTGLSTGADCMLRFRSRIDAASGSSNRVDYVVIDGITAPATSSGWPREGGGWLTLKSNGSDFSAGSDNGEFLFTNQSWINASDFDVRSRVTSITDTNVTNSGGLLKAGLMIRTGSSTANATGTAAAYAGVFVTTNQGVRFQWRAANGSGTTGSSTSAGPTAPEWVRLVRSGSALSAYYSSDGTTWTQVGTPQTLTMGTTVLAGVALTSRLGNTAADEAYFSTASFDHFTLTEAGLKPTLTPRVDDWSVGYDFTPPPAVAGEWAQTSDTDFGAGAFTNVAVTGTGDAASIQLAANGGGYQVSGVATSALIAPAELKSWDSLSLNGTEPAGTQLRIDVLDGASGAVLASDLTLSGSPSLVIDEALHPTLRLRARFTGGAPGPAPSVTDTFTDNSFNTTLWTDRFFTNSTDPDAAYAGGAISNLTFATAITGTDGFTTADAQWARNGTGGAAQGGGTGYARTNVGGATGFKNQSGIEQLGSLSGYDSATVTYYFMNSGTLSAGDTMTLDWSTDGGSTWTTQRTFNTAQTTWSTQQTLTGLPVGTNCQLRFRASTDDATRWWAVDTVAITPVRTAHANWPKETGGALQLSAEGPGYSLTAATDVGEFTYINPTQATWVAADDFDAKVRIDPLDNTGGGTMQAGVVVRAGGTEANAYANNARSWSLFRTPTSIVFAYRNAAGGNAASASVANTTSHYLRVAHRSVGANDTYGAWYSADNVAWTQLGTTQTVTADAVKLPGIGISSGVDIAYSQATFDDFSVVSLAPQPPGSTPRIDDWTIGYHYYGEAVVAGDGQLTCVSCHNAHGVQKGTDGQVWAVERASSPTNTKNAAGGVTDFCLGCHTTAASRPSAGISVSGLVPYTPVFTAYDAISAPFFTGWDKSSGTTAFRASGHFLTTGTKALCENCHDPHGSDNDRLTAWTRPASFAAGIAGTRDNTSTNAAESNLCFQCHGKSSVAIGGFTGRTATGANGVGMDIATPLSTTYGHRAGITATGLHKDTETGADLGAGKRHAECVDCHDPHAGRPGVHTTGTAEAGAVLYGAVGARPSYTGDNWGSPTAYAPVRLAGSSGDYEAYVCFKCHSSNVKDWATSAPTAPSSLEVTTSFRETDIAREFNPSNFSGHNVTGDIFTKDVTKYDPVAGVNRTWWKASSLTFASGWAVDSAMTCSDCHDYDGGGAQGPHGSSSRFLLKWGGSTKWYDNKPNSWGTTATNFCAGCHPSNSHGSWLGQDSGHNRTCNHCHVVIPHGWKRPRLLRGNSTEDTTTGNPYVVPDTEYSRGDTFEGISLVDIMDTTDGGLSKGDCEDRCSTGDHPVSGNTW